MFFSRVPKHLFSTLTVPVREWDQAKQCLAESLELSRHEQSYVVLGKVHLMTSDVQGAVEVYREAVKAFPESPSLNTTLGLLYIQTGNHQAAFECLGTALAFEPQNSRAILAAGSMMQTHQATTQFIFID